MTPQKVSTLHFTICPKDALLTSEVCSSAVASGGVGRQSRVCFQDRLSAAHRSMVTGVTHLTDQKMGGQSSCWSRFWSKLVMCCRSVVRVCSCYPRMVLFLSDAWLYCLSSWLWGTQPRFILGFPRMASRLHLSFCILYWHSFWSRLTLFPA